MASTTPLALHQYKIRDQSTSDGSKQKAMRIGTIHDDKQGFWVSYDRRGNHEHTRYWDDDGILKSSVALKPKIHYAKGLELSLFKAKKKTEAHKPQQEKRSQLIKMIYHQGGVQYEGDVEKTEAIQEAKDQKKGSKSKKANLDSGKMKNTTPRKTQKTIQDPNSILQQLITNACSLPATPQFAKKLRAIMKKFLSDVTTPPTNVIHEALVEAHTDRIDDAHDKDDEGDEDGEGDEDDEGNEDENGRKGDEENEEEGRMFNKSINPVQDNSQASMESLQTFVPAQNPLIYRQNFSLPPDPFPTASTKSFASTKGLEDGASLTLESSASKKRSMEWAAEQKKRFKKGAPPTSDDVVNLAPANSQADVATWETFSPAQNPSVPPQTFSLPRGPFSAMSTESSASKKRLEDKAAPSLKKEDAFEEAKTLRRIPVLQEKVLESFSVSHSGIIPSHTPNNVNPVSILQDPLVSNLTIPQQQQPVPPPRDQSMIQVSAEKEASILQVIRRLRTQAKEICEFSERIKRSTGRVGGMRREIE